MNQILKNKIIGVCLILVIFFGAGIYLYTRKNLDVQMPQFLVKTHVPIAKISGILAIPLADDRVLMGASHNVFIGKVLSQIGTREVSLSHGRSLPVSQFSVKPVMNIKGDLQATVTVEQTGGYQDGMLFINEDGDAFGPSNKSGEGYLMQPGVTYLFSTRYESPGVYYLWDFPTASKLISDNSSLSDSQLQFLATNDLRVQQLEAAYPNEILVADDVRTGNTRNSYLSTHIPPPAPPSVPTSTNPVAASSSFPVISTSSASSTTSTNAVATSTSAFISSATPSLTTTDSSSSASTATSSDQ